MMSRRIVIFLWLCLCLGSCSDRPRTIPPDILSHIYSEMYIVDQWVQDNPSSRRQIDTTLVYDRVFRRYGYSFEDYDHTVRLYIQRPDRFEKVFQQTKDILDKRQTELAAMVETEKRNRIFMQQLEGTYDSLGFWPACIDSTDLRIYVQRGDSVRTDIKPPLR